MVPCQDLVFTVAAPFGRMAAQWELIFSTTYQHWSTGSGTERKFLASGGAVTTHLNGVDWDSTSVMAGAAYHF